MMYLFKKKSKNYINIPYVSYFIYIYIMLYYINI